MLDNFLNDDEEVSTFLDELEDEDASAAETGPRSGFFGMAPFQRFVVLFLFFLMVLTTGSFLLVATGSMSWPF